MNSPNAPAESSQNQVVQLLLNLLLLATVLYCFFLSIELLASSIKLFGKDLATQLFDLTRNPFIALFIGIAATSLMQSSSATTSMVVGMVASGTLAFPLAVPIVMGANIGTSITNTLVSLGHIGNPIEFRRAFAASTVHDMFNLIAVLIFFPLEITFHFLDRFGHNVANLLADAGGIKLGSPLKMIVKPAVHWIIDTVSHNPWVCLVLAMILLFGSITFLTKVLKKLFMGRVDTWFQEKLFNHAYKALILGVGITAMVQSSSITTSLIVPLAGAGILNIHQIFPYTLGANIGTTVTALMASLVTTDPNAVAIALVHLLFNLLGTIVIWPIRRLPIYLAETLAKYSVKNRLVPVLYVGIVFIALPLSIIFLTK